MVYHKTCGEKPFLSDNYLLNKVPKKKAEKTPYELWKGMKPSYITNGDASCGVFSSFVLGTLFRR